MRRRMRWRRRRWWIMRLWARRKIRKIKTGMGGGKSHFKNSDCPPHDDQGGEEDEDHDDRGKEEG